MGRGQIDPNDLVIGDEAEAVITRATPLDRMATGHAERIDTYIYIECAGENFEDHIWASQAEGERLKEFFTQQLRDWGYDDEEFHIQVEGGGEYDWIVDEGTDLKSLATEILGDAGFMDQKELDEEK